jgi:hypothetical protein
MAKHDPVPRLLDRADVVRVWCERAGVGVSLGRQRNERIFESRSEVARLIQQLQRCCLQVFGDAAPLQREPLPEHILSVPLDPSLAGQGEPALAAPKRFPEDERPTPLPRRFP